MSVTCNLLIHLEHTAWPGRYCFPFFFKDRTLLCSPSCLETCYIQQASFKLAVLLLCPPSKAGMTGVTSSGPRCYLINWTLHGKHQGFECYASSSADSLSEVTAARESAHGAASQALRPEPDCEFCLLGFRFALGS